MSDTVEMRVARSKGYSGMIRKQGYVAVPTGIGSKGGILRDFIDTDEMDWGDSEMYRKNKGRWTAVYHLSEGLYIVCPGASDPDKYIMVYHKAGSVVWRNIGEERMRAMLRLMGDEVDDSLSFEMARLATLPPVEMAVGMVMA